MSAIDELISMESYDLGGLCSRARVEIDTLRGQYHTQAWELDAARAELAALRARVAELEASTVLTPRRCVAGDGRACWRKGWAAAREAAAEVCYNFPAKYPLSPRDTAAVCGDNIRALQPPADCGETCNPLEPDAQP